MKPRCFIVLTALCQLAFALSPQPAKAQADFCGLNDTECLHETILQTATSLTDKTERDKTLRELAKSWAAAGNMKKALEIVPMIETPDTRAMTIRGIGMELSALNISKDERGKIFSSLREEAEKMKAAHAPSYAIALTYIAMSQAFAGDNEEARKTAGEMENEALRHKAFGETAEIQAERGDYKNAKISLDKIDDIPYKNKAYATVSRLLASQNQLEDAYDAAMQITNPYLKATALQNILNVQGMLKNAPVQTQTAPQE